MFFSNVNTSHPASLLFFQSNMQDTWTVSAQTWPIHCQYDLQLWSRCETFEKRWGETIELSLGWSYSFLTKYLVACLAPLRNCTAMQNNTTDFWQKLLIDYVPCAYSWLCTTFVRRSTVFELTLIGTVDFSYHYRWANQHYPFPLEVSK